ncbi:hypothetical protein GS928_25445 [Rhodococcus hoagii]|nr:hypothetical protein [Prescottella equi]
MRTALASAVHLPEFHVGETGLPDGVVVVVTDRGDLEPALAGQLDPIADGDALGGGRVARAGRGAPLRVALGVVVRVGDVERPDEQRLGRTVRDDPVGRARRAPPRSADARG